jgi:hypothetical protein
MSLLATRLQNFRADSMLDKWETRASRWGAIDLFMRQTADPAGIISQDLIDKAVQAVGSTLEVPVINYDSGVSVANTTIPLTISENPSTSALQSITFTQYFFGFKIYPAQFYNNEIRMQRYFNEMLRKHVYAMAELMDTNAVAVLEANKTQVLADDLGGRYNLTSDVVVAPLAEQDAVIGDINPLMHGNDFYGPFDVLANPSMESHVRNRLLEKGEFNTEDKRYQYNDKTFNFTNNIANAAGQKATAFAVQAGSIGMVQQFAPDCVLRHETHKHRWDIETLPILNMPIGTYFYDDAENAASVSGAATAHLTASKVEAYGFHTAIAWIPPYNSDLSTRASAIAKLAIATS